MSRQSSGDPERRGWGKRANRKSWARKLRRRFDAEFREANRVEKDIQGSIESLDFTDELNARGIPWVSADADGNVIRHFPASAFPGELSVSCCGECGSILETTSAWCWTCEDTPAQTIQRTYGRAGDEETVLRVEPSRRREMDADAEPVDLIEPGLEQARRAELTDGPDLEAARRLADSIPDESADDESPLGDLVLWSAARTIVHIQVEDAQYIDMRVPGIDDSHDAHEVEVRASKLILTLAAGSGAQTELHITGHHFIEEGPSVVVCVVSKFSGGRDA